MPRVLLLISTFAVAHFALAATTNTAQKKTTGEVQQLSVNAPRDAEGPFSGTIARIVVNADGQPDGVILGEEGSCKGPLVHLGPETAQYLMSMLSSEGSLQNLKGTLTASGYSFTDPVLGAFMRAETVELDGKPITVWGPRGRPGPPPGAIGEWRGPRRR